MQPAVSQAASVVSDRIDHPPLRREFDSPDRRFRLVIETADRWRTQTPTAQLFEGGATAPRWSRVLQQHYGPRYALVNNAGSVLLLDEWINITSPLALMLIDADNQVRATHAFDAIVAALGVPPRQVSAQARHGTWISAPPQLAADGRSVRVASGGRTLVIALDKGALSSSS